MTRGLRNTLIVTAIFLSGLAAITLLLVGTAREHVHPGANVILISIDTLRADHLGCYGYGPPTSPAVDRFARESVLFEQAIAQAPSTLPSHASIFTSLIPSHHGALFSRRSALPEDVPVLAGTMRGLGYETVSINDGGQIASGWGLDRGFDLYESLLGRITSLRMRHTVARFLEWLDSRRPVGPFFAFLHTYETHVPYFSQSSFLEVFDDGYDGPLSDYLTEKHFERINARLDSLSREDKEHVIATYDADIRSMDDGFAQLVQGLCRRGLYDDTLMVFLSDHGEELGEHGRMGLHSHSLYDELLRVPLVIRFPGGRFRGARVRWQVRLLDVLPTILDALGAHPPPGIEGASLLPMIARRERAHRPAVSQQDVRTEDCPVSLRTGDWKYYRRLSGERPLLFDLAADPAERADLLGTEPKRAAEMSTRLEELLSSGRKTVGGDPVELPQDTVRQLRELGYVE